MVYGSLLVVTGGKTRPVTRPNDGRLGHMRHIDLSPVRAVSSQAHTNAVSAHANPIPHIVESRASGLLTNVAPEREQVFEVSLWDETRATGFRLHLWARDIPHLLTRLATVDLALYTVVGYTPIHQR